MAAADITAKDTLVKGVNSTNNFIRSEAHLIDGAEHSGILAVDTHDLFKIPVGNVLTGFTVISLDTATTAGTGESLSTAQFKIKVGSGSAEAIHTAIAVADLASGDTVKFLPTKIKCYEDGKDATIQLTVGTAAFTKLKLLVIAEYIPVTEFLTQG